MFLIFFLLVRLGFFLIFFSVLGVYDHSTPLPDRSIRNKEVLISVESCRRLVRTRDWWLTPNFPVKIKLNHLNTFKYHAIGNTSVTADGEVKCNGERTFTTMGHAEQIVIAAQVFISVEKEHFKGQKEITQAVTRGVNLPCSLGELGCETAEGTFFWTADKGECPQYRVARNNVRGAFAVSDEGVETFVSSDDSLIRLQRLGTSTLCDRTMYATPYEDLFILELDENTKPLTRLVGHDDVNVFSFVKNRDDFLFNDIKERLEGELTYIQEMSCQDNLRKSSLDFFLQMEMPALTNLYLGDGTFATSAG